LKRPKEQRYIN